MSWLFNLSGFVGLTLFLASYALVNLGVWNEREFRFHLPNFIGALLMIVSLLHNWNLPVFVLEICWALIAAYGMRKAWKN